MSKDKNTPETDKAPDVNYPELGEVTESKELSPESLAKFSAIVGDKLREIERKELEYDAGADLLAPKADKTTPKEREFVAQTANLLTRSVLYVVGKGDREVIEDPAVSRDLEKVVHAGYGVARGLESPQAVRIEDAGDTQAGIEKKLDAVVAVTEQVPTTSAEDMHPYAANMTDLGMASAEALSHLAEAQGGLRVDEYLKGNFQSVIAQLEAVETESGRAA